MNILSILAETSSEVPDYSALVKQGADSVLVPFENTMQDLFNLAFGFLFCVFCALLVLFFFLKRWKMKKELRRDVAFVEVIIAMIDQVLSGNNR